MEGVSISDKRWMELMEFGNRLGCHQRPDRSFFLGRYQFPVCARCTGVIIGEVVAIAQIIASVRIKKPAILASLVPMGLDWGLQYLEIKESTNIRRLITGILGGIGLTFAYFYLLKSLLFDLPRKVFGTK